MPGLCGIAQFVASTDLRELYRHLRSGLAEQPYKIESCLEWRDFPTVAGAFSDTGVVCPNADRLPEVTVLLEGWLSHVEGVPWPPVPPKTPHEQLVDLYRREGPEFVSRFYGSFAMMVRDTEQKRVYLFADHSASRPLFWTVRDGRLIWTPELNGLLNLPGYRWELSRVAIANFLTTGFHFANVSWLRGVYCLRPGEYLVWSPSGLERKRHFLYRPGADASADADLYELADRMGEAILHAVERCYRVSGPPLVALSGGWDSRVVLAALAEIGAKDLRATTSGAENRNKHGDGYLAAQIARQYGAQHSFVRREHNFLELPSYTRRFGAETNLAAYHIGELEAFRKVMSSAGTRSVYRGDEVFGYQGQVCSPAEAMAAVMGIRPIDTLTAGVVGAFRPDVYEQIRTEHRQAIEAETDGFTTLNMVNLKDMFFLYHRVARYIQQVNYQKLFVGEVFNPFLDREILELMSQVPAKYRLFKLILTQAVRCRLAHALRVPFASFTALSNTEQQWRTDPQLSSLLVNTIMAPGDLWFELFSREGLGQFVDQTLATPPWRPSWLRRQAARVLMSAGLHGRTRDRHWRPGGQASAISILLRMLILRVWLDQHANELTP